MIERFIAPALTFAVLVGGHIAIATALLAGPAPQQADSPVLSARAVQAEQLAAKRAS
jgi:hypothetical protein